MIRQGWRMRPAPMALAGIGLVLLGGVRPETPIRAEVRAARVAQGEAEPEQASICGVQGRGAASPLVGATVRVTGSITGVFPDWDGFFIEDAACDVDASTSNGIFVYDPHGSVGAAEGVGLSITGEVREYYGLTEIAVNAFAAVDGLIPPEPAMLNPPAQPADAATYWEAREGMLAVTLEAVVVGPTDRFGEAYVVPATAGIERVFRRAPDGRVFGLLPSAPGPALNEGDRLGPVIGNVTYDFGAYKLALAPSDAPEVRGAGREPEHAAASHQPAYRIGTYNLENFFDDVDDPGKDDAAWTLSPEDYARSVSLRARSIDAFLRAPEILVVEEVENLRTLQDLAADPALSGADYGAVLEDGPDTRGIDVGLLYRRGRFRLVHVEARQGCVVDKPPGSAPPCALPGGGTGWALFSRPPLVVELWDLVSNRRVAVVANHFKSKSGGDAATTPIREAMARHVLALVDELAGRDLTVLVVGDLNDFPDSSPLATLTAGGLVDLHSLVPPARDYTYIYQGASQVLDYVLAGPGIAAPGAPTRVADVQPVHINADFAAPDPDRPYDTHRASDHDPLVVTLDPTVRIFLPEASTADTPP